MFVEHRFSCQNIISFNIIRENHILLFTWAQQKYLQTGEDQGALRENWFVKLPCTLYQAI